MIKPTKNPTNFSGGSINEFEKKVVSYHSIKVVQRVKKFFKENNDELLTIHDFNSIEKQAWKETREHILKEERKRLELE